MTARLAEFFERPLDEIVTAGPAAARAERAEHKDNVERLLDALETGSVRAATRDAEGRWQACDWVKRGILAAFRLSANVRYGGWPGGAVDRSLVGPRVIGPEHGVRLVPGGTAVRRGSCLRPGTVVMPPAYVNVGAYVGEDSMVDSHALVGSCAQIGRGVHLSAGVQVGGVLEPVGARPVVVEDGAFVGAQSGLFEGVVVREGAVLAPGTLVTASTTVFDLVHAREVRGEIPPGAVVVPGSRPANGGYAAQRGLSLYAPCIVKYRDASTDAATVLEDALR